MCLAKLLHTKVQIRGIKAQPGLSFPPLIITAKAPSRVRTVKRILKYIKVFFIFTPFSIVVFKHICNFAYGNECLWVNRMYNISHFRNLKSVYNKIYNGFIFA